jgi:hypothetical protein
MNINKLLVVALILLLSSGCGADQAQKKAPPPPVSVKKSSSGICHDETSSSYNRTKNFTPYDNISACIASGGRLPEGAINDATNEAIEEGRDFVSLYNRSDWPHWTDADGDCQNTRHELLIATSQTPISFKTIKECNVLTGSWYDPYSGDTFTDSHALDLDHIVPLKFAHGHGADEWSRARKQTFANDIDNLLLVQVSLNRQKGAKAPDEWMPPNQQYRCEYIKRFIAVMDKYELKFIPSEKRIVERMTKACGS